MSKRCFQAAASGLGCVLVGAFAASGCATTYDESSVADGAVSASRQSLSGRETWTASEWRVRCALPGASDLTRARCETLTRAAPEPNDEYRALALNVAASVERGDDPLFGSLVFASGNHAGWTVDQLVAAAGS